MGVNHATQTDLKTYAVTFKNLLGNMITIEVRGENKASALQALVLDNADHIYIVEK